MPTYALRRTLQAIPILLILSAVLFAIVKAAPGGPLAAAERNPNVTAEQLARLRERLGLDQPISVQYGKWLVNFALAGEWGESIKLRRPVSDMFVERLADVVESNGVRFVSGPTTRTISNEVAKDSAVICG